MSHTQQIDSNHRGLFIFLIDQSSSTEAKFGSTTETVKDAIARCVNSIIDDLVNKGDDGEQYKCRYDIACLGYGNDVASAFAGTLSNNDIVSASELFEFKKTTPNPVLPKADGGTDMKRAFTKAKDIATQWITKENHMDCFPPIILNITDGDKYTGEDPEPVTNEVKKIATQDGEVLIWNIHVSPSTNDATAEVSLLSDDAQLTDAMAKKLFAMSSTLPSDGEFKAHAGKRAFAYNLNAKQLLKLLRIGTIG